MDMGLDEIIKSKSLKVGTGGRRRGGGRKGRGSAGGGGSKAGRGGGGGNAGRGGGGGNAGRGGGQRRGQIVDARLKIIAKTRAKIRDARDRLMEIARSTDARSRIRGGNDALSYVGGGRNGTVLRGGPLDFLDEGVSLPRRTIRNQAASALTFADRRDQMLYRTIKNRSPGRGVMLDNDVVMITDDDDEWLRTSSGNLQGLHNIPVRPTGLRTNPSSDDSWLRPAPTKQATYNSRGRDDVKSRLEPVTRGGQPEGYRIIVSNLQSTVTHEDIKELFEDIGVLIGSRVVRPGTAEVMYKNMDDALAAVDTYHNRQLDGQPMKCMLVKPSNASGKGLTGTKGSIVPDLHAIHKALFNK